ETSSSESEDQDSSSESEDQEEITPSHSTSSVINSRQLDLDVESDSEGNYIMSSNGSRRSKVRPNIITSRSTDPRIKKPPPKKRSVINSEKVVMSSSPITSSGDAHSAHRDRIRDVIQELLVIAKKPSEKKGLGLILSVQNGHAPHVHGIGDPPSPTVILLYELQELLGYGDEESSKYINEHRTSSKIHLQVDPPDDNDDTRPSLRSMFDNAIDNARVIRRRSSPNFRTSPSPPSPPINYRSATTGGSEVNYASLKMDSNLHPHDANVNKPLSWASSLGFWTRWKV
ncbi:11703_t:CDS:1, partial [Acaulospora morrowiae]